MKAHCMFEQSGTFKNEFRKLGYEAYDYDILNDFGETDYVVDLFAEIEEAYQIRPSIFDRIAGDDLIMAFFPCVRFESQIILNFRGKSFSQKNWTDERKLEYTMKLQKELTELYCLISKMVIVCLRKGLRMVIENPYSAQHYLTRYWCIEPKVVDMDRIRNGDSMKKPTQYFFINCEPKSNFIFEPLEYTEKTSQRKLKGKDGISRKTRRSMIHPQYANRFIRQYLRGGTET